jgi:2'-5' RNA ligase
MRLFVAIEVPSVSIREFGGHGEDSPSHITLKFLGDVPEERLKEISEALERELSGAHGGKIVLQGLGAFPSNERPRVLWVGVAEGSQVLSDLNQRVERALTALGFPREDRPFHPHVTLARLKDPRRQQDARDAIAAHSNEVFGAGEMRSVLLKESRLSRSGAQHLTLLAIPLKAPPS